MVQNLILNRYRLITEAGRGGFATVAAAWDTRIQRRVAIKTLRFDIPGGQGLSGGVDGNGKASVEVSGINNRTAAELRREYERRMQEYQKATQRDDPNFPYIDEMKWMQAAERRLAELGDGKRQRPTATPTRAFTILRT